MAVSVNVHIVLVLVGPDGTRVDVTPALFQHGLTLMDGDVVHIDIPGVLRVTGPHSAVVEMDQNAVIFPIHTTKAGPPIQKWLEDLLADEASRVQERPPNEFGLF